MTILESLTAIAKARPELLTVHPDTAWLNAGEHGEIFIRFRHMNAGDKGALLWWCFKTAAREGLDFAVAQVAGEHAGVCGPRRSEGHDCPTEAALAALAAALTTNKEVEG